MDGCRNQIHWHCSGLVVEWCCSSKNVNFFCTAFLLSSSTFNSRSPPSRPLPWKGSVVQKASCNPGLASIIHLQLLLKRDLGLECVFEKDRKRAQNQMGFSLPMYFWFMFHGRDFWIFFLQCVHYLECSLDVAFMKLSDHHWFMKEKYMYVRPALHLPRLTTTDIQCTHSGGPLWFSSHLSYFPRAFPSTSPLPPFMRGKVCSVSVHVFPNPFPCRALKTWQPWEVTSSFGWCVHPSSLLSFLLHLCFGPCTDLWMSLFITS